MLSKPIRTVLRWQLLATAVLALVGGAMAGAQGALSAALGGAVSLCAGWLSAQIAARGKADSAGGVLVVALKAEGIKIGVILVLLGVVFATYEQVVAIAFLGSFMATAVIFSMAFFIRDYD
ncbi:MAG TPA: ATP synthase subunit I [Burkholderiales bacterium]|nr:ATP synthase subunit I [Burkholderiales bacterium]